LKRLEQEQEDEHFAEGMEEVGDTCKEELGAEIGGGGEDLDDLANSKRDLSKEDELMEETEDCAGRLGWSWSETRYRHCRWLVSVAE
jgi:hypothetical protein